LRYGHLLLFLTPSALNEAVSEYHEVAKGRHASDSYAGTIFGDRPTVRMRHFVTFTNGAGARSTTCQTRRTGGKLRPNWDISGESRLRSACKAVLKLKLLAFAFSSCIQH
jgi:hypothetical protein